MGAWDTSQLARQEQSYRAGFGACRMIGDSEAHSPAEPQQKAASPQMQETLTSNETIRLLLESAGVGIFGLDAHGNTIFANRMSEELTGWTVAEMLGQAQHALLHHSHADGQPYLREECPIYAALRDGKKHQVESEVFWRKDGTSFPVFYTSTPMLRDGKPVGAVVVFKDISARLRIEAWEKAKGEIFRAISAHVPLPSVLGMLAEAYRTRHPKSALAFHFLKDGALYVAAQAGLSTQLSTSMARLAFGEQESATAQACLEARVVSIDRESAVPPAGSPALIPVEIEESAFAQCQAFPLLIPGGEGLATVTIWSTDSAARSPAAEKNLFTLFEVARMAVEHARLHDQLQHRSQHDALTGLPNRLLLEDRLQQAMHGARRHGKVVAVCYLDLDRFKHVNDSIGHAGGDDLLRHVAAVLRTSLREVDTIARQGGDEFIMVLPELNSYEELRPICERLVQRLAQPVHIQGHQIRPVASIGVSFYPAHGTTVPGLLKRADLALYRAKQGGRSRLSIFEESLEQDSQWRADLLSALPFALERNELSLVYQPLYDGAGTLLSFEALLRWQHPQFGAIPPDRFIPLAEETGLILPIGEWILTQAFQQALHWNRDASRPTRILVNVSGVQLADPQFTGVVQRILNEVGLHPTLLELEITETWYVDTRRAKAQLQSLRDAGIGISIDDFGRGHASFGYLQDLPADTVKIDRAFTARLDGTPRGSAAVHTIIGLATRLGMKVVAEGVETESQRAELLQAGCTMLQGYLLAKPLTPELASQMVHRVQHTDRSATS